MRHLLVVAVIGAALGVAASGGLSQDAQQPPQQPQQPRPSADPYATVAVYAPEPLLSGYISKANLEPLAGSAAVVAERFGRGAVICILDDPNFRGFWFGTNKLLLNALFFGSILD